MPRQVAASVANNFRQGLITEATGLNFPENACTETYDCIFETTGSVVRRFGFDFEEGYAEETINRDNLAVSRFLWKNVAGNGDVTLVVLQVGELVYFYDTSNPAISTGIIANTIDLTDFLASGAPSPGTIPCQFSSGTKHLIVTHPYCDPFYVSYNTGTSTPTGVAITIMVRDFEGDTADPYAIDERATSTLAALNVHHYYNLLNQGWTVTNLTAWDGARTDMPSNADVMWRFKNSSDAFDTATVANDIAGNTPASPGHYILTVWDKDRDTASGLTGTTSSDYSYQRPTTSAWFAGRVFYAGINYAGANASIYFTQVIEKDSQYGLCYQASDPTAEDLHDLLPADGGVITIREAGTIYKLFAMVGGLVVFANNGIWFVGGSTGLGFKADDFTVQKISSTNAISGSSFVDVAGSPAWWNAEGVYLLQLSGSGPEIKNLSLPTINSFYETIPTQSKIEAQGFYNQVEGVIQWLYRSTEAGTPEETYSYDRILNFNITTGAFYPWKFPASAVTVNGIIVLEGTHGSIAELSVIDDSANTVQDDSGNDVVAYSFISTGTGVIPSFKYIVSYPSGGSYKFTFAETNNTDFVDWASVGESTDFDSYFISGYMLHGAATRKFQDNWVFVYSNLDAPTKYTFRGLWDFANSAATNRWTAAQTVTHSTTSYDYGYKKLKILGSGRALQFKVNSVSGYPFSISGWGSWETANTLP